jgi:putative chitinase
MLIKSKVETKLKKEPIDSIVLKSNQVIEIPQDTELLVNSITLANSNHYKISIDSNLIKKNGRNISNNSDSDYSADSYSNDTSQTQNYEIGTQNYFNQQSTKLKTQNYFKEQSINTTPHFLQAESFQIEEWFIYIPHWDYKLNYYEIGNDNLNTTPYSPGTSIIYYAPTPFSDNKEKEGKKPQQNIAPNTGYLSNLIPQSINQINWNDWKAPVSKYFTVGEVCQWDIRRIPNEINIQLNILKLAQELDKIRTQWGSGIGVTSWYRPPKINAQVGGVKKSRHISGIAVDIYPINGSIARFQEWLDGRWYGNLGYGSAKGFVHIDMGNEKGWMSGGSKGIRWNY